MNVYLLAFEPVKKTDPDGVILIRAVVAADSADEAAETALSDWDFAYACMPTVKETVLIGPAPPEKVDDWYINPMLCEETA